MVDPRFSFGITRVRPKRFRRHIEFLLKRSYTFTTITSYLKSQKKSPKQVALTFDDGYSSIIEYALPILQEYNIPATVFVNPGFVGQYNTWDVNFGIRSRHSSWKQLEQLRNAGWEIGLHGMGHRDFTKLAEDQLENEIGLAQKLLIKRLGVCSGVICYPFGNVNASVCARLKNYGFTAGVVMGRAPQSLPSNFRIPRVGIYLADFNFILQIKLESKNKFLFSGVQNIMGVCSNATVACKQKRWKIY